MKQQPPGNARPSALSAKPAPARSSGGVDDTLFRPSGTSHDAAENEGSASPLRSVLTGDAEAPEADESLHPAALHAGDRTTSGSIIDAMKRTRDQVLGIGEFGDATRDEADSSAAERPGAGRDASEELARAADRGATAIVDSASGISDAAARTGEKLADSAHRAADSAARAIDKGKDAVRDTASDATRAVKSGIDRAGRAAGAAAEDAGRAVGRAADAAAGAISDAERRRIEEERLRKLRLQQQQQQQQQLKAAEDAAAAKAKPTALSGSEKHTPAPESAFTNGDRNRQAFSRSAAAHTPAGPTASISSSSAPSAPAAATAARPYQQQAAAMPQQQQQPPPAQQPQQAAQRQQATGPPPQQQQQQQQQRAISQHPQTAQQQHFAQDHQQQSPPRFQQQQRPQQQQQQQNQRGRALSPPSLDADYERSADEEDGAPDARRGFAPPRSPARRAFDAVGHAAQQAARGAQAVARDAEAAARSAVRSTQRFGREVASGIREALPSREEARRTLGMFPFVGESAEEVEGYNPLMHSLIDKYDVRITKQSCRWIKTWFRQRRH